MEPVDDGRRRSGTPGMVTPLGGEPVPHHQATGKQVLAATWRLLKQDRELVALPFVGAVFGILAFAIFFLPGYGAGWLAAGRHRGDVALYAGIASAGLASTVVGVFFQTALVIGANERADGGAPTVQSCLRGAWQHRWKILGWSVVTSTVGFALGVIEERLGFLGWLFNFVGGLAWGIATFVVVPVMVSEQIGPVQAVRRSGRVLRATWGTSIRTALRGWSLASLLYVVPTVLLLVGVVMVLSDNSSVVVPGVLCAGVGGLVMVGMVTLFSAVEAYAQALIYRYAMGRPTPGMDPYVLAGAFQPKSAS